MPWHLLAGKAEIVMSHDAGISTSLPGKSTSSPPLARSADLTRAPTDRRALRNERGFERGSDWVRQGANQEGGSFGGGEQSA